MDLALGDKRAIVCASSKGLGRASAMSLAREGARVAMCARTRADLDAAAEDVRAAGAADVIDETVDLSDLTATKAFAEHVIASWGGVDILVANAGGPPPGPFIMHDDNAWRAAFDLNFMNAVTLIREVLPGMAERRWGRIVAITSVAVKQPVDGLILSNAIRAATTGMCRTLANEMGPAGITVNTVCPGFHMTDRMEQLMTGMAEQQDISVEEATERFAAQVPMQRVGDASEFGDLVCFLASDRASYITAQAIVIDGGLARGLL